MEKQKKYDWQETNLALFGSDIEKKIKEASAGTERAWSGLGDKEELRVWRIEKFKVVAWPKSKYGSFHEGDSYIVYNCYKKNPDRSDALAYDIHFWIGESSSQDEYATAAYKTVELDHFLKDRAIQHREVMNHESRAFLNLFEKTGVRYLEGGVESGFNHVEDEVFQTVLYQIKGIKGALILQQIKLRRDYLNSGDVFVLDMGETIYQWNGKESNAQEKLKAKSLVNGVVSDRGGKVKSVTLDEGQGDEDVAEFWDAIPGERKLLGFTVRTYNVQGELEGGDDSKVNAFRKQLYKISDASGSLKISHSSRASSDNRVNKNRLDTKNVFLLDDGFQLWVWVGEEASSAENGLAMSYAMRYIKSHNRPNFLPISRIKEGAEPAKFNESLAERPVVCFGTFFGY
mmetsp:Transcript_9629/g.16920  ORF Transcript_9629/g.16920 Transcript_9629/m.16920 type:complete len:401 (-) Transcript_9629:28-1230(-)